MAKDKEEIRLTRGIPATIAIKDKEVKRVVDAVVDSLRSLEIYLSEKAKELPRSTGGAPDVALVNGGNMEIDKLGRNRFSLKALTEALSGGGLVSDAQLRLTDLVDVNAQTPSDDDVVRFSTASGKWENGGAAPSAPENPGTYETLGSAAEGAEAADSSSFVVGTDGKGLYEWFVSRVGYFEAGDKTLYAYFRRRIIDQYGKVYSVSGETRVAVDVAVAET